MTRKKNALTAANRAFGIWLLENRCCARLLWGVCMRPRGHRGGCGFSKGVEDKLREMCARENRR